jgi:MoaA/NifB/PqqE/SkfB family radical SAM enzyme
MFKLKNISIDVEISTKCTIKCPACPRTYWKDNTWNTGFMKVDVLKSFVSNSNYWSYNFCGAFGDALYHPNFNQIMEFMISQNKGFSVETNGAYRNEKFWNEFISFNWNPRYHRFIFSIDGLEDTNHIYRKNSDWKSIMLALNTITSVPKYRRPHLKWKYLVFPYNEHQVEEARALAKDIGFDQFETYKSLRKYNTQWFENDQERRNIQWQ